MKLTLSSQSKPPIPHNAARWLKFITAVTAFNADLPITQLSVSLLTQSSKLPIIYGYRFTTVDSREWEQTIEFSILGGEPSFTYRLAIPWTASECAAGTPVINAVIELIRGYEITALTCDFE